MKTFGVIEMNGSGKKKRTNLMAIGLNSCQLTKKELLVFYKMVY
jgi:hypothetical protein